LKKGVVLISSLKKPSRTSSENIKTNPTNRANESNRPGRIPQSYTEEEIDRALAEGRNIARTTSPDKREEEAIR